MTIRRNLVTALLLVFFGATAGAMAQSTDLSQQKSAMQELSQATSGMAPGLAECPDPEYYKLNPFLYFAIPIICQTPIQTARAEAMMYLEEEMNKPLPITEIPQFLAITLKGLGAGVVYLFGMLSTQVVPTENPAVPLPLSAAEPTSQQTTQ